MKRAIIIGATSGIGEEVAKLLIQQGWHIGIAGRREEALEKLQATAPGQIEIQRLDVTDPDAPTLLETLIRKLGGMDLFFLSSGRPETGNRTKYRPYQRRRIHPHGDRRLQSLQKRRRWAYRCHQLHCRHQRIGHRPGLFRNETLPEYLHRSLGTTLPDATLEYPFHRHTPGFRRYRLTEKWQVPHAYASQSGSEEYRPCLEPEKTGHCD